MKRTTGAMVLLAAMSGCVSTEPGNGGQYMSRAFDHGSSGCMSSTAACAPSVPGFQGPCGQPVAVAAPYNMTPPGGADLARSMVRESVPLELVQQTGFVPDGKSGIIQAQGMCPPGGGLMPPGMPGPMCPGMPGAPGMSGPPGAVAAVGALTGGASPYPAQRTEVRFTGPNGMRIAWFSPTPDGRAGFGKQYLEAPGRYNFLQAAVYRLKLSDVPNRPGVELYPTLEVVPGNAKTATFLAHSAVPVTFTEEDFNQVASGNYLVKVVYLPDPQFQDLAVTGTDEVISSRLEPGVDPIAEAHRRGSILLVVRLGNIDLEAPNTPAMDAPSAYAPRCATPPPAGSANRMMLPPVMPPAPGVLPLLPEAKPTAGQVLPPLLPPAAAPPVIGSSSKAQAPAATFVKPAPSSPVQFTPPPVSGPFLPDVNGQTK
jgi:hypothetical protein